MRVVKKGATGQSIYVEVLDSTSTTGGRKTGLAFNTSSLTAYYVRNGGSATSITLATLAAANSAWSSGGFKEVDATNMPGIYRLDVPDAAFASGAESVVVTLKGATGMVQVSEEIQLAAVDLQDAVRGGLTALPNANAEAAGGLYTRGTGAGQINQPANGMVDANVVRNAGTAITAASGRQEVNVTHLDGTALSTHASGMMPSDVRDFGGSAGTFASGRPEVNATHLGGTSQTGRDIGASVLLSSGTGAGQVSLSSGTVTVGTNNDKTGYGLSSAAVQAVWDALTSALTTAGSIGKLLVDNVNATIGSRLASASYAAPPSANDNADALLDRAAGVETSLTVRQALRGVAAVLFGKASGMATTTAVFRDTGDTKDRITATVDSDGNRSAVTKDFS